MRNLKTLLELLLENFTNNWKGEALCHQIFAMKIEGLINGEERKELNGFIKKYTNQNKVYLFSAGLGDHFFSEEFENERPLRIEWLTQIINDLK